jgi:SOS response regulatory protein OraA/RecX
MKVILEKAKKYCSYQERSQQEVRDKLYEWGLHRNEVEQAIAQLVSENYLNEQRFAIAYAGGKFRMKGWGKIKIKLALKQKKFPITVSGKRWKKSVAGIIKTCSTKFFRQKTKR